tara:strand:- start:109 stop:639 length:531 start_codon:yes stop_codon:yes gene_type:complete
MSISTVTSEALQQKLRELLPSQDGFGTDLSASDTIIPIIDLTAAAEGSDVGENLQTAIAFGSQTAFSIANTTTVIANTPGFYRIFGCGLVNQYTGAAAEAAFEMTDGATTKRIWGMVSFATTANLIVQQFDFIAFLGTGESISGTSNELGSNLVGSSRQIATAGGALVNPSGFTPQ